jgi:branched-chain amino acid transport system permease protein
MQIFAYLLLSGLTTGALYSMVALGIVVVYKAAGVINFALGEQFALGAYFAYALHVSLGLPYLPSFALAVLGTVALGVVTHQVGFRPVARGGMTSVLLATLGLSFIFKGVARYFWGGQGEILSFPPVVSPEPVSLFGIRILSQQLLVAAASVVVMASFLLFFRLTRVGKWMQATANNPRAARLVGVRVDRVYLYTFMLGAAVAGAAAVLMAPLTLLYPDLGFSLFVRGFAAAVLGGVTSLSGAMVGGLLIGILEQMGAGYLHTSLQEVSAFIVIIVVLLFMPTGLLGAPVRRRA